MDYKLNCESMKSVGFTDEERSSIWKIVSAILHLVGSNFGGIHLNEGTQESKT